MFILGEIPLGDNVPFPFDTYDSNGGSVTITGLAVTDIEIYKDGSVTQRASDNGYTLADTDGIDFDGSTGLHGFLVDTSDNSDAGFYAAGSYYWVHVNAITVDSQTVRFTYWFRMVKAEATAGTKDVNVAQWNGTAVATPDVAGVPNVNVSYADGSAMSTTTAQFGVNVVNLGNSVVSASGGLINANVTQISGDGPAADNLEAYTDGTTPMPVNVTQISGDGPAADNAEAFFDGTGYAGTNNVIPLVTTCTNLTNAATAGGLTAAMINDVETAVDNEIVFWQLDHLIAVADSGGVVVDDSIVAKMVSKQTPASWGSFANTTDSLEAALDNQQPAAAAAIAAYDPPTRTEATADKDELVNILQGVVLNYGTVGATGNTTTTVHLDGIGGAYGDDDLNDLRLVIKDNSANEFHSRWIEDYSDAGDLATVALLPFTPTSADSWWVLTDRRDGQELSAAGVTAAQAGLATAAALSTAQTDLTQIKGDLPSRPTKNTALANFSFVMRLTIDHVTGATGKTVTATRNIDGAGHSACANAVSEVANGEYKIDLAASDLNGDVIVLRFVATDCDDTFFTIVTQP